MSEITDWEPTNDSPNWEDRYSQQLQLNGRLLAEINDLKIAARETADLVRKLQADLKNQKANSDTQLQAFKTDVLVTLKALELVAIASQRHGKIELSHAIRDERLKHLQSIIENSITDFSDRSITNYAYDF